MGIMGAIEGLQVRVGYEQYVNGSFELITVRKHYLFAHKLFSYLVTCTEERNFGLNAKILHSVKADVP